MLNNSNASRLSAKQSHYDIENHNFSRKSLNKSLSFRTDLSPPKRSKREERDQHGANPDLQPYNYNEPSVSVVFCDKTQVVQNSPAVKQGTIQEIQLSAHSHNSESKFGRIYDVPTPYLPLGTASTLNTQQTNSLSSSSLHKQSSQRGPNIRQQIAHITPPKQAIAHPQVGQQMECDFLSVVQPVSSAAAAPTTSSGTGKTRQSQRVSRKQLSQIT
jgi:hypothetical protein